MPNRTNEATPLLSAHSQLSPYIVDTASPSVSPREPRKASPLPRKQLFVLCLMRMTEPISFTVIFPFVNAMLRANLPPSVPDSQLGYYAGLVESAFAFVQFLTIFWWARLSDRVGRKPILLIGLFGSFLSVNAFGFAKTFPQMVLARSIAGLMNGNIVILKSVLAEITDETNQARAFSLIPLCFAVGSIVGNGLGGWLVGVGEGEWWQKHPFWLPCGIASCFNLCAIVLGCLFLKETLPNKALSKPEDTPQQEMEAEPAPSIPSLLSSPLIRRVLGTQLGLNFLNACHAALLPLFCYTSIAHGGLSLSSSDIGTVLAVNGAFTIFIQLILFPTLERRLGGPQRVYVRVTACLPFLWLCFPIAHQLAASHPSAKAWPMSALFVAIILKGISNMSIVSSNLLVNNSAPTRSSLATMNSISQMAGCLSRTMGPTFSTSLFAFSTSRGVLGGQFSWLVMWGISATVWVFTMKVKAPQKAAWRVKQQQQREDVNGGETPTPPRIR
ncbi:potential transmembrane protein [Pseudozyma hubeiensis SY62]|uniref:Potential transmembrane protein n=1 Tax=Pseudozyma hubeiensis (strain SY62) TaxID=1305764 RepID=R9NY99_PSEHS|nr:potential transmembrane protein [Pseudozyma hubeiensis SY62]GAC93738.1 potential transmembrane protein [Pseudozyma hubeiensis SY62]